MRPGDRLRRATLVIEHIGMGLARATEAAQRLSTAPPPDAVAVAGLGGALGDKLEPGDLVVAELLVDPSGRQLARLGSASFLAAELRHLGLRARPGTIVSTDHIVTGAERKTLAALGADVVDMESTAVAGAPWRAPLAVVRAISDTPGRELFSAAGVAGVLTALRTLRASRRALANWAAAVSPLTNKSKTTFVTGARSSGTDQTAITAGTPAPDERVHFPVALEVR